MLHLASLATFSAVAFGMALRGGGPAVVILLDRHANVASLASDWTCTHEFLHLGVPRLPSIDSIIADSSPQM